MQLFLECKQVLDIAPAIFEFEVRTLMQAHFFIVCIPR